MTQTLTQMSGAELKVRLTGMALAPAWFGDRLSVSMRTVVRWFDGPEVDQRVADELEELSARTLAEMRDMLADIPDDDSPVRLITYRTDKDMAHLPHDWPSSWHRALTARVLEHLRLQDRVVEVDYA